MPSRACRYLLLVGLQGERPASFCTQNLYGRYACPKAADETYAQCDGYEEGAPLVRMFSNEGAEANAFHAPILQSDPAFVEIMIQFMVPDWRKETETQARDQGIVASRASRVSSWFKFRSTATPPAPPPSFPRAPLRPPFSSARKGQEESVLEAGSQVEPARAADDPASAQKLPAPPRGAQPKAPSEVDGTKPGRAHRPPAPAVGGHVPDQPYRGSAIMKLVRSRHYAGEVQLVERRGLLQVEWAAEGVAGRPPLALLWHSSYGSGNLLLGQQSASTSFLIYGTRLRKSPKETSLWARHDIVCGLDLRHGETLWRWRNLFLACPPQVVDGVVLLRRLDTLWAVDEATGQRLWDTPAESEHAEEAGLAEGKVVFHTGKRFRAVELQTGKMLWEVPASLYSPRPVASGPRVVLASDDHIRAVSSSSGTDLWRVACHGPENRVPAVSEHHVVFWTWDAQLHAVSSATGRRSWSLKGRTFYPGDDPLMCDGEVLVRDGDLGDASLVAVDENRGRVRWRVPLEENLSGSLGVSGRQVLVLSAQGEILSLERDSGALLWRLQCPASAMVLAHDRLLTWHDGVLYCYDLAIQGGR